MVFSASSLYRFCWTGAQRVRKQPEEDSPFSWRVHPVYLADDVLHLLSVEDVRGVDHSGVGGPVHLCVLFVLGLRSRNAVGERSCLATGLKQAQEVIPTWLRMSVAFLALMKSGVSVAKANIPLPLISCSSAFLYSLC